MRESPQLLPDDLLRGPFSVVLSCIEVAYATPNGCMDRSDRVASLLCSPETSPKGPAPEPQRGWLALLSGHVISRSTSSTLWLSIRSPSKMNRPTNCFPSSARGIHSGSSSHIRSYGISETGTQKGSASSVGWISPECSYEKNTCPRMARPSVN